MKKYLIISLSFLALVSCDKKEKATEPTSESTEQITYETFGDSLSAEGALTKEAMLAKYETLKPGDTLNVKFASDIKEICQKKGCWMSMDLADGKESFVKFKDYKFFVPMNAQKHKAVVSGKAFVSEISVDELKHYAKDEGKSAEEIEKITEPKRTLQFMADGVLIAKQ
ncbi:DUF4920 domain-containing protein [Paenimyroides ceti]